jgi:hypothetical protein
MHEAGLSAAVTYVLWCVTVVNNSTDHARTHAASYESKNTCCNIQIENAKRQTQPACLAEGMGYTYWGVLCPIVTVSAVVGALEAGTSSPAVKWLDRQLS